MKKEKSLDNRLYCRGISLFFVLYSYHYNMAMVSPAITMLTIDISLMRMLSDGPEVSLKGSPTVSPTMVALWLSLPLPSKWPSSIIFLALSHAPPELDMKTRYFYFRFCLTAARIQLQKSPWKYSYPEFRIPLLQQFPSVRNAPGHPKNMPFFY